MDKTQAAAPTRILVVGGTGRVGKEVIKRGLYLGYQVKAITRNPNKVPKFEEGEVEWQQCDATDKVCMTKATENVDAIISSLGPDKIGKTTVYSDSIKVMLDCMKENKVKRILAVTAERDDPNASWWFKYILKKFLTPIFSDMEKMENILKETPKGQVQWTVVRVFKIWEHPYSGNYRLGKVDIQPPFLPTSYTGDIADFMFKELKFKDYVNNIVSLGL